MSYPYRNYPPYCQKYSPQQREVYDKSPKKVPLYPQEQVLQIQDRSPQYQNSNEREDYLSKNIMDPTTDYRRQKKIEPSYTNSIQGIQTPKLNTFAYQNLIEMNSRLSGVFQFEQMNQLLNQQNLQNLDKMILQFGQHKFSTAFMPKLLELALQFENLFPQNIKTLGQGSLSLTRQQCACLVSHMFLGTLEQTNPRTSNSVDMSKLMEISHLNRNESNCQKLLCIVNYLMHIIENQNNQVFLKEKIQISKHNCDVSYVDKKSSKFMKNIKVDDKHGIQDYGQCTKVDFANKYIGGGILKNGSVQEEIMFSINPEMLVALLFVECLQDNEAIVFNGVRQYCDYKGYSNTFQFSGLNVGKSQEIIAMDSLDFSRKSWDNQYQNHKIDRELVKCTAGFLNSTYKSIVTGNWGCGAFKGDPQLKFLIQWIGSSIADCDLIYCSFKEKKLMEVESIISQLKSKSIQDVKNKIYEYDPRHNISMFDFILNKNSKKPYPQQFPKDDRKDYKVQNQGRKNYDHRVDQFDNKAFNQRQQTKNQYPTNKQQGGNSWNFY